MGTEISKILAEKQDLLQRLVKLGQQQGLAIKTNNYDSILSIIGEKQSIIEQVNLMDLEIKETMPGEMEPYKDLLREIQEIMSQAIHLEEDNVRMLEQHKTMIYAALKEVYCPKRDKYADLPEIKASVK
ncbi:MAG: hypothetical protein ACOXZ5_07670 [Syntrophomonadaceae bacterium]|jgi:flagellar biosynthesis/type III secretory pathway chaperone